MQYYFPLRTPTPILVIRDITANDLVFMDPKHYKIKTRLSFLNRFIEKFNGNLSSLEERKFKEASRLKLYYERILFAMYFIGGLFLISIIYLIFHISRIL